MTYKIKVPARKKVPEPEEIVSFFERLADTLKTHVRFFISTGVGLLLAAAAVAAFFLYERQAEEKASFLLSQAFLTYNEASFSAEAGKAEGFFKKAVEMYRTIVEKYPRSKAAPHAQYYLGNSYFALKDYASARDAYTRSIEKYSSAKGLLPLVYQRSGYAYLALGDQKAALTAFDTVPRLDNAKNADQAIFEAAQLHLAMGNKEVALQKYEEIVKTYPHSPLASEAQVIVKAMTGEGSDQEKK